MSLYLLMDGLVRIPFISNYPRQPVKVCIPSLLAYAGLLSFLTKVFGLWLILIVRSFIRIHYISIQLSPMVCPQVKV